MDLHLAGKVAVVTGGSSGIGLAVVRALAAEGMTVVAAARHAGDDLPALAASTDVKIVLVDLADPGGPDRLIGDTVDMCGGIDVLVNNVGAVRPRLGGFASLSDDDWQWSLALNLLPAIRTIRAALPHLLERAPAAVVTVSSVNAFLPDPLVIDYSAAKAALSNVSKSLSKEFGPRGIRFNTVSPGPVQTPLWLSDSGVAATVAAATGKHPEDIAAGQAAAAPTGRFTRPDEVADLVALLAGDRAGNTTGADVVIDGGLIPTL